MPNRKTINWADHHQLGIMQDNFNLYKELILCENRKKLKN